MKIVFNVSAEESSRGGYRGLIYLDMFVGTTKKDTWVIYRTQDLFETESQAITFAMNKMVERIGF
jgi:hypothetical protein